MLHYVPHRSTVKGDNVIEIFQSADRSKPLPFKQFTFSDGAIQVTVGPSSVPLDTIIIRAKIGSANDLMALAMTVDALDRMLFAGGYNNRHKVPVHLICPFLPYARQDRVMEPGEALGIKVVCDMINRMNFTSVEIWDVHSDVSLALLDRVKNYGPETFVQLIPLNKCDTLLVAPDAGALKKVGKVATSLGFEMIRADKIRSTKNGSITGTKVYSAPVGAKNFLIVDDICDGGRTFIELAKELKPLTTGKIYLYVTHGIFSKGLEVFEGLIDRIYTANPFPGIADNALLTVLNAEGGRS